MREKKITKQEWIGRGITFDLALLEGRVKEQLLRMRMQGKKLAVQDKIPRYLYL